MSCFTRNISSVGAFSYSKIYCPCILGLTQIFGFLLFLLDIVFFVGFSSFAQEFFLPKYPIFIIMTDIREVPRS